MMDIRRRLRIEFFFSLFYVRHDVAIALTLVMGVGWCEVARAEDNSDGIGRITMIAPPADGLWLTPKHKKKALYGASHASAGWRISQWRSPDEDLPPFRDGRTGSDSLNIMVSQGEGGFAYTLSQNGSKLACTLNGKPNEFDLFVSAISGRHYDVSKPAAKLIELQNVRLDEIDSLHHRISLMPLRSWDVPGKACGVDRAVLVTSIVLRNDLKEQTFFYQLRLKNVGFSPSVVWWARGARGRYGVGENVEMYGESQAEWGRERTYNLDVGRRLRAIIKSGKYGMDSELHNWYVSASYHGQAIWGRIGVSSRWTGFELKYTKRK